MVSLALPDFRPNHAIRIDAGALAKPPDNRSLIHQPDFLHAPRAV
jgi:hypothetical protein